MNSDRNKIESRKIGFIAILGLLALLVSIFWLKGYKIQNYQQYTFYFRDVNGLEEGAALRWNGLKIGIVSSLKPVLETRKRKADLPSQALIEMGKNHLALAEKVLSQGGIESIGLAREHTAQAQVEIMLGQAARMQEEVRAGQHVEVEVVITSPDIPIAPINRVTIVPTGLIGEQYLDISTIDMSRFSKIIAKSGADIKLDSSEPRFVVLEPIKLERLLRANIDSAEAIKDLTNRVNSIVEDEDFERIRGIMTSLDDILSNPKFRTKIKDPSLFKLLF